MSGIFRLARAHVLVALRERVTLFWFLVFPLFLLTLLAMIFGNLGTPQRDLTFTVSVVDMDAAHGGQTDFSALVVHALTALSRPQEGRAPLFDLIQPPPTHLSLESFLDEELAALRIGHRDAVVEIPEGFDERALAAAGSESNSSASLIVYTSGGRTSSEMALSILQQVTSSLDQQMLTTLGRFDPNASIATDRAFVGSENRTFSYIDFLLPGIVLMGFFTAGLFNVPGTILFGRERKILKTYWVTPLDVPKYLAGFSLGHLVLCILQLALIGLLGRFAFGAEINLLRPLALLYLLLGAATFLSFGFFVAAVARTANAGMAIANILNMPMMFLGGLFFPIGTLPLALRAVMMINPVTYLADGLRSAVGADNPVFPMAATLAVPVAWILFCFVIASLRLRWGVER